MYEIEPLIGERKSYKCAKITLVLLYSFLNYDFVFIWLKIADELSYINIYIYFHFEPFS